MLTDVRSLVRELSEKVQNRCSTTSIGDDHEVTRAESIDDVHDIEQSLRDVEKRKSMVCFSYVLLRLKNLYKLTDARFSKL
jgi:hypothetical protein